MAKLLLWALLVVAFESTDSAVAPMRGWMSWERYTCETDCIHFPETCISERLIMTTADAMQAEGYVAAGYNYIQIDDCWSASQRAANGSLLADPVRFPHGMRFLSDYVHQRGLKLGLYGDVGDHTCGGYPGFNVSAVADARADTQLTQDAETLSGWGMDSLKVDGCAADAKAAALVMNITYPKLGKALQAAAKKFGRATPWYSCSWPAYVGDELCGGGRKEPCVPLHEVAAHCNSARVYSDIADTWTSVDHRGVADIVAFFAANPQLADLRNSLAQGEVYFNDADQLMVGNNGLSRTEAEVQMGMWAMLSTPLIMSTELRNKTMPREMKAILLNREVLAIADDELGLQAYAQPVGGVLYNGATTRWNKTLADGSVAVALVNTGNFGNVGPTFGDFNISFTPSDLGLACQTFTARDLFKYQDLGNFHGGFWREVDESSMVLLRVRCKASVGGVFV